MKIAELQAKESSQENIVTLVGLCLGYLLTQFSFSSSKQDENDQSFMKEWILWINFILLTIVHLYCNFKCINCLNFNTLNRYRTCVLLETFLTSNNNLKLEKDDNDLDFESTKQEDQFSDLVVAKKENLFQEIMLEYWSVSRIIFCDIPLSSFLSSLIDKKGIEKDENTFELIENELILHSYCILMIQDKKKLSSDIKIHIYCSENASIIDHILPSFCLGVISYLFLSDYEMGGIGDPFQSSFRKIVKSKFILEKNSRDDDDDGEKFRIISSPIQSSSSSSSSYQNLITFSESVYSSLLPTFIQTLHSHHWILPELLRCGPFRVKILSRNEFIEDQEENKEEVSLKVKKEV